MKPPATMNATRTMAAGSPATVETLRSVRSSCSRSPRAWSSAMIGGTTCETTMSGVATKKTSREAAP